MNVQYAGARAIEEAAAEVGLDVGVLARARHGIDVVLRSRPSVGYAVKGRRHVVCVHGYEAFIEALLERKPNAFIRTQEETYRGLLDFDARQDEIMARLEAKHSDQECGCEEAS